MRSKKEIAARIPLSATEKESALREMKEMEEQIALLDRYNELHARLMSTRASFRARREWKTIHPGAAAPDMEGWLKGLAAIQKTIYLLLLATPCPKDKEFILQLESCSLAAGQLGRELAAYGGLDYELQ